MKGVEIMNMNHFKKEVQSIDWRDFPDIPVALFALADADQESNELLHKIDGLEFDLLLNARVVHNVLSAIGNDHCGVYYSVARQSLPFIVQIALYGNHVVARNCAINILIDLYYFCPEGSDEKLGHYVKEVIETTVTENRGDFIQFALDDKRNKSLIENLLDIIDDGDSRNMG
jgi:hypothetical protein